MSGFYKFLFPTVLILPSPDVVNLVEDPSIVPVEVFPNGGDGGDWSFGQKVVFVIVIGGVVFLLCWGRIEAAKYYFEYKPKVVDLPLKPKKTVRFNL